MTRGRTQPLKRTPCIKCGSKLVLRTSGFGPFLSCSRWPECDIIQTCDANGVPTKAQADRPTRQARQALHRAFDQIWKRKLMKRTKAYGWLATKLGLSKDQTHIRYLTKEQAEKALAFVEKDFQLTPEDGEPNDGQGQV